MAFRSRMRWVLPMPKAQTGLAESPFLPIILRAHLDGARLTTSYNGFPHFPHTNEYLASRSRSGAGFHIRSFLCKGS